MSNDFVFYVKLGLEHVLDFAAYDHILFLTALALPFTFKRWKAVLLLATIFTIAHCTSLALSAYEVLQINSAIIEFFIPVTIALTALYNLYLVYINREQTNIYFHAISTAFFGLIHGFGFSNYFNMMMAEETEKLLPLLGFASGIEIAQVLIVLAVLLLAFVLQDLIAIKQRLFIAVFSFLIVLITIPMLIDTFPS